MRTITLSSLGNIVSNGFVHSCPAPKERCNCETQVLLVVACLALVAGIVQAVTGYYFSLAILSDSVHAMGDAGADFFGAYIAYKVLVSPSSEKRLSLISSKVIGGFIVVGGSLVAYEALERWVEGTYLVSPLAAMLAGSAGYLIDRKRVGILKNARSHYPSDRIDGYIDHAQTDKVHSLYVAVIGGIAWMADFLPVEQTLYMMIVQYIDFSASIFLSGYMFRIGRNRWYGKGCGHNHAQHNKKKRYYRKFSNNSSVDTCVRAWRKQRKVRSNEHHDHHHGPGCNHKH